MTIEIDVYQLAGDKRMFAFAWPSDVSGKEYRELVEWFGLMQQKLYRISGAASADKEKNSAAMP